MFTNLSKITFNVTLPSSTTKEVIEWFEVMEDNNKLADTLVGLVYDSINRGTTQYFTCNDVKEQLVPAKQDAGRDDLFEKLYNWQDSNSAIFLEDKNVVNKEKRKMLCV